ncbi:hypothetical protein [Thorsellia anophelis]|uniref:Uncharacterized protein n=1 Tax=Thorsellia anophelis DSM 18579 TaxID=1123402 RepID=A0A1I0BSH8_9GAMM|nr:hypothetical protein [Thorsellia anophelis]SET09924.1 hypothetical protein SAMN02583745_01388 [Thorsellia anophelis DSM 18579]
MKKFKSEQKKQFIKALFLPKREFPRDEIKFDEKKGCHKLDERVRVADSMCYPGNFITKFNSTYFEMVDSTFTSTKTSLMFFSLVFLGFILAFSFVLLRTVNSLFESFTIFSILFICLLIPSLGMIYIFFNISFFRIYFTYTHNPIRFNRKEQLVHFSQRNGEQITVSWKDIIFTCEEIGKNSFFMGNVIDQEL